MSDADVADVTASDCTSWSKTGYYGIEDVVCEVGQIYECMTAIGCEDVRPSNKASSGLWRKSSLDPPASKVQTAKKWKSGAKYSETAYEEGMGAMGKDGSMYSCLPREANPGKKVAREKSK